MKYIASCSFGKDSIATVILAYLHNEPLDLIVYSEVMFDKKISGEHPAHLEFIYNKAKPTFENWGYKVKIVKSNKKKSFLRSIRKRKVDLFGVKNERLDRK